MTTQLTFDDCTPDWPALDDQPGDHTPTRFDLRQDEMHDLGDQGAGFYALRTAHDVDVGSYL